MDHPQTNVGACAAPFYRGLTDEQCRLIHCASLEILERTGILLYYQPAIDLLKMAGCIVEEKRVRIPAHMVEWALRAAPSHIMIYDRSGKPVMPLGDRISTFGTGSDCLNILDHRTGERRKALLQDIVPTTATRSTVDWMTTGSTVACTPMCAPEAVVLTYSLIVKLSSECPLGAPLVRWTPGSSLGPALT